MLIGVAVEWIAADPEAQAKADKIRASAIEAGDEVIPDRVVCTVRRWGHVVAIANDGGGWTMLVETPEGFATVRPIEDKVKRSVSALETTSS